MPEYLAPGVYVEETSFRSKSIEGVGTSTTAFAGPTRKGPTDRAVLVTSVGEFTRIYGGSTNLSNAVANDANPNVLNLMAHAVRVFFDNGGSRLYIARTFQKRTNLDTGVATKNVGATIDFTARVAGAGLNGTVTVTERATPATATTMTSAPLGSLLRIVQADDTVKLYVRRVADWVEPSDANSTITAIPGAAKSAEVLSMNIDARDADGSSVQYEDVGFDAAHPRYIENAMPASAPTEAIAVENPFIADVADAKTAEELYTALLGTATKNSNGAKEAAFTLAAGNDGSAPPDAVYKQAFELLEDIEDISIVAAPAHGTLAGSDYQAVQGSLISHCERMRYRIAVLDPPDGQQTGDIRATRSLIDSKHAAIYYPWVVTSNPLARPGNEQIPKEIALPPSGFICGIYGRNDSERGVFKAPANEIVRGALRFKRDINQATQEVLNPEGINCLRYFYGRGNRVWGARTTSSDPEWKYVNVRRYFIYLERSIDRGTQWAVFEPNSQNLWANIRETISAFLYNEWRNGALLGAKPEEAYFVRCDRSTMTQNDLDNGRLICEIGVAPVKPAEFVIFRIGQKTADARS